MTKTFAKRLKILRERTGRTQEEVADLLDIRRQTYNSYEQGYIVPRTENIINIAKILNTTPNFLLGWDDNDEEEANKSLMNNIVHHFTDAEINELINYAKYIIYKRKKLKGD